MPFAPLTTTPAARDRLASRMDFDHVIEVKADGRIVDRNDLYAPSLYDGDLDTEGWTLLDGYSSQDGYSGPIMHDSECIGGGMAEDILTTPGVYVAIFSSYYPEDEDDEMILEGWAIARLDR